MNFIEWLTEKQPKQGYLLGGLKVTQQWLEIKCSLNSRINELIRAQIPQNHGKAPRWVSEFYLIFTIVIAAIAYYLAVPVSGFQLIGILTVVFPLYLIAEVIVFLVGWVFVHETKLHSIERSLLAFILNMFELSLLFGTLEISIGNGLPQNGKLRHFFDGLVNIATVASPTVLTPIQGTLEIFRLFASLLLVLVIVGSLVGGVLRLTVKPGEGK
jgi:hypothetical protein